MATAKTGGTHKIMLPISKEMKDDVWVCINGVGTLIQRGVEVEVSDAVYEVLQNTQKMQQEAIVRSMKLQSRTQK